MITDYFCDSNLTRNLTMILRSFSLLGILLTSVLFFSCESKEKKEKQLLQKSSAAAHAPVRADAYIATAKQMTDNLEIPGTIVANQSTEIHPEVAGRITGIFFKEGAFVNKGALLIKLYDADLQAQKQKLLVQIKVAEANENRSQKLLQIGGISKQDYEATELTTASAKSDLAVLETNIRKTEVRAPFSGKLGLRMVSIGAYVSPTTVLTTISEMNQMRVDFTVPEKYTTQVGLGKFVNFTVEGSSINYAARVIATESNISENTRTLQVRAAVQGKQAGLVPGAFAKVALDFAPDTSSVVIPTQAVIPEARGKKVYVYKDSVAKYIDVTTGLRDSVNVQITSGLKVGDTVLVTGLLSLKPNSKVIIRKVLNGTNNKPGNKKASNQ